MKTILSIVSTIIVVFAICSCGGKKDDSVSVQKEFFGVTLGEKAESVYDKLQKQNFVPEGTATDAKVRWTSKDSVNIMFGGRQWTRFTTYFYNGKLGEFRFYTDYKDHEKDAKANYDQLKETLTEKYGKFEEVDNKKDNMVKLYEFNCKDGKIVLSLQKLTTDKGIIFDDHSYQVGLTYVQGAIEQENLNEL